MNRRSHLEILGPVDTAFYYVDREVTPMNLGALTIFEGKVPFDDFLKMVESRIYRIPLYQQRVIQAPLKLGQPSWVLDPDFYVGNHVFKVELPAPGSEEQLRELSGHLIGRMLDRAKPLWEIYLIEGLEGDRTAVLFKVHHCMVDGLSAVELFTLLMDLTAEPPPFTRPPIYDPPYLPTQRELVTSAIRADLPNRWGVLKKLGGDVVRLGAVMADKEKRRQTLVGLANLINDNLSLIKPLPINGQNTGRITLGWTEFSLNEVRAIRANQRASVNDVMLTVLAGAMDLYMRDLTDRAKQDFLRVLVPVNIRQDSEKSDYGNRISVLPVDLPFNVIDPLERLRKIADYSQIMKQSSLTIGLDFVLTVPSLYPSFAQPLVWEIAPKAFAMIAHSWCTNVAGPQIPVYLLGHQMLQSFGFFPLNPSMGLATVILSYNQKITMTLIADAGIVPDVLRLRDCLQSAYRRLRDAANVPEMPPLYPENLNESARQEPVTVVTPPVVEITPDPAPVATEPPAADVVVSVPQAEGTPPTEPPTAVPVDAPAHAAYSKPEIALTEPPAPADALEAPATVPEAAPVEAAAPPAAPPPGDPITDPVTVAIAVPAAVIDQPEMAVVVQPSAKAAPMLGAAFSLEPDPALSAKPYSNGRSHSEQKPTLFSEDWAQAYEQAINQNHAYRDASLNWDAGQLAFIIRSSPRDGLFAPAAVLLDLHRGVCRAAHSAPLEEARHKAAFVIEGEYSNWMKVLNGEADALKMLMRGGLRLSKGSMLRLLPFTQSAQELVLSAQHLC